MKPPALASSSALLLLAVLVAIPTAHAAITIGPGPLRGVDRAGVSWFEEFQDWTHGDLRALDAAGLADARYNFGDGLDDSRDLIAFYHRSEGANLYFRVDLYDLALGAEAGGLNLYLAIDATSGGQAFFPDLLDCQTDRPWELCLALYQPGTISGTDYRLFDSSFNLVGGYLGSYFHSQIDAVEFGITRQALLDRGWDGTSPLTFQVFSTKDGTETNCAGGGLSSDLTDAIEDDDRGCSDGVLNGGTSSTGSAGFVWYASIAHGNQSVNQADDIGAHIYDSQASTGISGGTGFLRALDTHEIFGVPLNIHPSGTLTIACGWATRPGGASDPQDGPAFIARVRDFVDGNQASRPGSLIGGVLAEHIMPYFEGAANAASLAVTDTLHQVAYGITAADAKVMHVPERVIRSQSTGLSPLDGHTFEDIAASPYVATYLDEITHLHWWFYQGENCTPDQGYRHKVHRINGVYCFMINDREDQGKFGNHDGGMVIDTRFSLLEKAEFGGSSEIVVVFDDWEALAGKSFDPFTGQSIPNNNPNQYHATIRWAANHPWIRIANLKDVLAAALSNPGAFVIDHGFRFDLESETYEYLKHSSEDSYDYWYYNQNAGFPGNEQNYYTLVPVITGPQGDYHARGATPADDGPPLPSGKALGDMNTIGSLIRDSWDALQQAPANRLRTIGTWSFVAMIYETAWHEEDQVDYSNPNCYGPWNFPDTSFDGLNTWNLRLANHIRQAGFFAAAARWADSVRTGLEPAAARAEARDLDFDGENEYVLRNDRVFAVFERYGGRCVLGVTWDAGRQDAEVIVGAPLTNPSAPGEEEYSGPQANRCSAFKDMNGGGYVDAAYTVALIGNSWRFTSPDGLVQKTMSLAAGAHEIQASYVENVPGALFVRLGLSPNPLDLAHYGHAHLSSTLAAGSYWLANSAGGSARVALGGATFNPTPSDAGFNRRNLALTEEVELSGDGSFSFALGLLPTHAPVTGMLPPEPASFAVRGPWPSPASGPVTMSLTLSRPGSVRWELVDATGRHIGGRDLGWRDAGRHEVSWSTTDAAGTPLPAGLYFVRVDAGGTLVTRRWVVLR